MVASKVVFTAVSILAATAVAATAQTGKPAPKPTQGDAKTDKAAVPAPAPTPAAAPAAPQTIPQPSRTEILTFDNWRLTCNDYAEAKKRLCLGQLQAVKRETNQVLFSWGIGQTFDGGVDSTVVTPTGVAIAKGIDLKIGAAAVRKLSFATCEPSHCTAQVTLDPALRKDLTSAETMEVIVYGSTGNNMRLELPLKGIDKVLSQIKN